jgi:hypothetical protein
MDGLTDAQRITLRSSIDDIAADFPMIAVVVRVRTS